MRQPDHLHCYVLTNDISVSDNEMLAYLCSRFNCSYELVGVDFNELNSARVDGHVTEAAYYRLFIPWLLPETIEKVIYLDCDLVFQKDITELFNVSLDGAAIGAVTNPNFDRWNTVQLEKKWGYFNSGVMLFDLKLWRKKFLVEKALQLIRERGKDFKMWDQDVLNAVIAGQWRRLDVRWNQQLSFYESNPKFLGIGYQSLELAKNDPWIVHYSSSSKPWHFADDHPSKKLYKYYRREASLPDTKYSDLTCREVLRWLYRRAISRKIRYLLRRNKISGVMHFLRNCRKTDTY